MGYENLKFKEGTKVVITGGAGFIGSNLCEGVLRQGADVICFDNLSSGKMENIEHLLKNKHFRFIKGDIQDFKKVMKVTRGADYIMHQAAWGSVPRSIEMPQFYELNNVSGTVNVFEAAKRNGIKKVVYASSAAIYGDSTAFPVREQDLGNVLSPYALTKKTDEEYAKLYWKLYNLPTVGLRYFNVFGQRQDPNGPYAAVIPIFCKNIINNEDTFINGDGSFTRDFCYVENVVEANIRALLCSEEDAYGEAFNVAYGEKTTLNELYETIASLLDCKKDAIHREEKVGDIKQSMADISKIKKYLGYDPSYSYKEGLKLAINWYKEFFSK